MDYDYIPDVVSLLHLIKEHSTYLYIKASPMIDITQSIRDLGTGLTDIWAVSIKKRMQRTIFQAKLQKETPDIYLHAINHDGSDWVEFTTKIYRFMKTYLLGQELTFTSLMQVL